MNYNNWNGRRSGRGRGRKRNNWNWRGRSYNRMPMLNAVMHNTHPGYNQNYQMHHENQGYYNYKPFVSPHHKMSPPPKPPSPLPGTEEYTQRNIQHTSDFIKRQLNIDSETCSASDTNVNVSSEQSSDNIKDDKTQSDNSNSACATVTSTRNSQETKKSSSSQQVSKQKTNKSSESINVQEIYTQIIQHISNLSHSKKINLVHQSTDGYDIAIQQVQKQKRLELSRALRDMSKRQTQNSNDGEVINAIIPDIGIKIEDLPKEIIADLSRTLNIELEDRAEQTNSLVDPEVCFKQAEAILSVNFENVMDDQGFNRNVPRDNFGFQEIDSLGSTFNYDYLNKSISPAFTYGKLEETVVPSTSNVPFTLPKPISFPLPTEVQSEIESNDIKTEEAESDDFTGDIDFCIKNLDVHKSYLTCFSPLKQPEVKDPSFESTDDSFKLPQIKVRTDLLTQAISEAGTILENQNIVTGPLQKLPLRGSSLLKTSPITSDISQLQISNVELKMAENNKLQLESSPTIPSVNVACNLESDTAEIQSCSTVNTQSEQNLLSDTAGINLPNLTQIGQDVVDKPETESYLSLSNDTKLTTRNSKNSKHSEKRSQHKSSNKEDEFGEGKIISEESRPFSTVESIPLTLGKSNPDLQFTEFTKTEELDDEMKQNEYPGTSINSDTKLECVPNDFPESSFGQNIIIPALSSDTKLETTSSELVIEETKLSLSKVDVKVDDSLLEVPQSTSSNNPLTEGSLNTSCNEEKKTGSTDISLSAIPESLLHTHSDSPQKRWKSPGEKKMIPNVPSAISHSVTQDNTPAPSAAEKSIDDILGDSDEITKSILEQMEEFNRSLMGITTEKEKVVNAPNKQQAEKELDFLDDKFNLNFLTSSTAAQEITETQNLNIEGNQPRQESIENLVEVDINNEKSTNSELKEDHETTTQNIIDEKHDVIKAEVKEESETPETVEKDDDMANIDVKLSIDSVEPKKEPVDDKSEIAKEKITDVIKSEPAEKEMDAAKTKHKESSKDRSRSNSKEKQHHRSGSKSKGHRHAKEFQESHKSSKHKEKMDTSRAKETQDFSDKASESSHRKIKTPAEKKETNLKIVKLTSVASTQTDFAEQTKKGKREVSSNRNSTAVSVQTDNLQEVHSKKGKFDKEKKEVGSVKSTQTDFAEQQSSKKAKVTDKKDLVNVKATSVISTQTEFAELAQNKKGKSYTLSTQTDFEPAEIKKGKTYSLSTQTDLVEPVQAKKIKSFTLSTQTDFVEPINSKSEKKETFGTKSTQTDSCDSLQPKKGKIDKIKNKSSSTQSETPKTFSKEVQVTSNFRSIEIQTDPFKMSLNNDIVDMNVNTEGVTGKLIMRKYAVRKLKDIDTQIEHLLKLKQNFYELMLESDDESETLNTQSTTQSDNSKAEPEKKDLQIKLEDVQQVKASSSKESETKSTPKSRKRKTTDVSNEDKNSKKVKRLEETESPATEATEPVDEVDVSASLESVNTLTKKDKRKRKIEEEKNATETKGSLNIKISLKNLKASPYRNESPIESSARNSKKSFNEEETVPKQKLRRGKDSKTKEKGVKVKEEKESRFDSSSIDTTINEVITESGNQILIKEEAPFEINIKEEIPDIQVEDVEIPDVHVVDENDVEERKTVLKIKLPMKRFRSKTKKTNSQTSELIDNVNLMMSKYSKELGKVSRSKRKSDRRSKQIPSDNVLVESNQPQKCEYDKRFFSCSVSLRRYNLQELNQLKETINFEQEHNKEVELEQNTSLVLSNKSDVNVDSFSTLSHDGNVHKLNDTKISSESLEKCENSTESLPVVVSDKIGSDMSPISLQMLDELKQVVDSTSETSEIAVTSNVIPTDDQEIEFNTFNSALLVLKVINCVMLAGSDNGKLYYYNIENGDVLHSTHLSKKPITCISTNKNEDKLDIYVGSLNGKVSVINFDTKHVASTIRVDEGIQCMELCWDYVFIGTHKGHLVRYDIKKQKTEDRIKIYETGILAIKATQEGARRVLLVATRNELVCVRDAMSGLLMRTLESSFYPTVYTLLLNNNFVYCGTSQHDILVYTFQNGQKAFTYEATDSKGVVCLKIVGNLLFAGSYNGNVYVYNTITNAYLGQIAGPGMILSMEILEDKIFLGTKNNKLKSLQIPKNFLDQL